MIKNIIFDLMNVIIKKDSNIKTLMNFTNDANKAEDLQKYIYKTEEWKLLDLGNISHKQAIKEMQRKAPKEYSDLIKEVMNNRCQYFTVNEETVKIAKSLKEKGYHLYLLSNITEDSFQYINKVLDLSHFVDGGVYSYQEHVKKPEHTIYQTVLKRFHLSSKNIVSFGSK